jgi:CHASE3 domain sensor protein
MASVKAGDRVQYGSQLLQAAARERRDTGTVISVRRSGEEECLVAQVRMDDGSTVIDGVIGAHLVLIQPEPNQSSSKQSILHSLSSRIVNWWLPDNV